jgi:hypothetical protein
VRRFGLPGLSERSDLSRDQDRVPADCPAAAGRVVAICTRYCCCAELVQLVLRQGEAAWIPSGQQDADPFNHATRCPTRFPLVASVRYLGPLSSRPAPVRLSRADRALHWGGRAGRAPPTESRQLT